MARLARARQSPIAIEDSEDEYSAATTKPTTTAAKSRSSPRKRAQKSYAEKDPFEDESEESDSGSKLVIKAPTESARSKRQIKLAPLKASESVSELRQKIASPERTRRRPLKDLSGNSRESSGSGFPRLNAFASVPSLKPPVVASDDREEEEAEVEESVWCGSDASSGGSDDELPSARKLWPGSRTLSAQRPKAASAASGSLDEALQGFQGLSIRDTATKGAEKSSQPTLDDRPSSSHDKENLDAILKFSPPRLVTRPRARTPERPITPPPTSPSKSRLVSPSKTKARIPTPPHRQSLDGFWNANTVNDWNDQYSPQKTLKSPKEGLFNRDQESTSPTSSPKKPSSSPTKRNTAEVKAKKEFAARKHALAEEFLEELDRTITSGQIASLSASTGGVRLVWSKTLNSTAGRANWRRETIKSRCTTTTAPTDSTATLAPPATTHKHHASIELAEKVIDDESRLLNVLAHEFCHLANFMVSGIKDQPHGASFKAWGAKCSAAFGASRGVNVTTKHSYAIDYKYVWRCDGHDGACGAEFKRHSKSIDPKRHTCGSCRGKLVQVKPVPRGGAGAVVGGKVGGYAGFVKMHFAEVRKSLPPGSSQKEVMEAVGRKYREEKEKGTLDGGGNAKEKGGAGGVEELANALDVVVLDD
ncbi:hypothetical protein Q7P37_006841 [Cladosporium fusiforme]